MACTQKLLEFEDRPKRKRQTGNAGGGPFLIWIACLSAVLDIASWLAWGVSIANEAWRWAGARSISIQISSEMPMQRFVALAALGGCLGVGLFVLANAYWQLMGGARSREARERRFGAS